MTTSQFNSVCAVTWLWRRWKVGSAILEEWNLSRDSSRLVAMPSFCLIVGCSNDKKRRPDLSFCRVPKVITSQGEQTEILSNERRTRWLAAISRDDLTESKLENDRVCGIHFHSGKAASLWDKFNLDWVPSLHLGHSKLKSADQQEKQQERAQRVTKSKRKTIFFSIELEID